MEHAEPEANALDRELVGFQATLQAPATSPTLAEGNPAAFEMQVRAVRDINRAKLGVGRLGRIEAAEHPSVVRGAAAQGRGSRTVSPGVGRA